MTTHFRPNGFRPRLETLEAREVPATPVQIGTTGVTLSGAFSTWNYEDGGTFTPSPVFADIDGNGSEELISVTGDKKVAAYTFGGGTAINLLRTFDTGAGAAEIPTTPLVITIPGIGKAVFAGDRNGNLYGWNAATGAMLPGFPASVDVPAALYPDPQGANPRNSILGPLGAGDLDGDGVPEIVATSYNQHVTAFRSNGTMMWRYANDDSVLSGVAVGDLDRDGIAEVVVGGDYSTNDFYNAGGNVTALSGPTGRRKWIKFLPQIGQSSPVLIDYNSDGALEVFSGTGINYPNVGNAVYGLDSNGNDLPGWPYVTAAGGVEGRTPSPPAAADLNNDGIPEIILGDYNGKIHAVQYNGVALWTRNFYDDATLARLYAAPVVLDIDGDNDLDVVFATNGEVRAYDGLTGGLTWSGHVENGALYQLINSPAVGKFKGDGSVQLAIMSNGSTLFGQTQPRSPSLVRIFDVDTSSTTPQWWASRGDASANVVRRTAAFANNYLTGLATYLGRDAGGTTSLVNFYRESFKTAQSLETASRAILQSTEGRSNEINRWYTTYLNRAAGQGGLDAWLPYLGAGNTFANAEALIVASQEAFNLSGGTNQAWVVYLYQKVLGRTPENGSESVWVNPLNAGTLFRSDVARGILLSQEGTERRVRQWYTTFAPGGTTPPAASLRAAGYDLRRGLYEETVLLRILGNGLNSTGSDYLSMTTEGAWLKAIYRDVLQRAGSQEDLRYWLQQIEGGTGLHAISYAFVNSVERNILLVKSYFRRYLNRTTDPSTADVMPFVNQLSGGMPRETLIKNLMASIEYAVISGGTTAGYVNAAWAHILGPGSAPDTASFNYWVNNPNVKQELPINLLQQEQYLFNTINADWTHLYLRRRPHTASNQSALYFATSPDPFLPIRPFIDHLKGGIGRQQDVEVAMLTSSEYIFLARYSAFWTGTRWKK